MTNLRRAERLITGAILALPERELRQFACRTARRAFEQIPSVVGFPDPICWQAIEVAERYAVGQATAEEMFRFCRSITRAGRRRARHPSVSEAVTYHDPRWAAHYVARLSASMAMKSAVGEAHCASTSRAFGIAAGIVAYRRERGLQLTDLLEGLAQ